MCVPIGQCLVKLRLVWLVIFLTHYWLRCAVTELTLNNTWRFYVPPYLFFKYANFPDRGEIEVAGNVKLSGYGNSLHLLLHHKFRCRHHERCIHPQPSQSPPDKNLLRQQKLDKGSTWHIFSLFLFLPLLLDRSLSSVHKHRVNSLLMLHVSPFLKIDLAFSWMYKHTCRCLWLQWLFVYVCFSFSEVCLFKKECVCATPTE